MRPPGSIATYWNFVKFQLWQKCTLFQTLKTHQSYQYHIHSQEVCHTYAFVCKMFYSWACSVKSPKSVSFLLKFLASKGTWGLQKKTCNHPVYINWSQVIPQFWRVQSYTSHSICNIKNTPQAYLKSIFCKRITWIIPYLVWIRFRFQEFHLGKAHESSHGSILHKRGISISIFKTWDPNGRNKTEPFNWSAKYLKHYLKCVIACCRFPRKLHQLYMYT